MILELERQKICNRKKKHIFAIILQIHNLHQQKSFTNIYRNIKIFWLKVSKNLMKISNLKDILG